VVAPKETNKTYSDNEFPHVIKKPWNSIKHGSTKGKVWKKPVNAIDRISLNKLKTMVKQMIENNVKLAESKQGMEDNFDNLHRRIQDNITLAKAQDNLHRIILEFEIERSRNSFWNEKRQVNRSSVKPNPLQRSFLVPLERIMQSHLCLSE
jgi:hypothetical protein